jgi:hypothetical protein
LKSFLASDLTSDLIGEIFRALQTYILKMNLVLEIQLVPKKWGNSFFNASSRSLAASFSPCLLHWTLQICTFEFHVLLVMVSKILVGTS